MFHLWLREQLADILLQEFYRQSTNVIYLWIENNFSVLISNVVGKFSYDIYVFANLLLENVDFRKKVNFAYIIKSQSAFFL